jgi:hypothetical protein
VTTNTLTTERLHALAELYQQGQGLGSAILRRLVFKADQDHVGCFLETGNPRNYHYISGLGFRL